MNVLWLLLLFGCCGNNGHTCNTGCNNSCVSHCHDMGNTSCIQPRTADRCDMNERESAWTPYVGKNKQDDCGCEHSH